MRPCFFAMWTLFLHRIWCCGRSGRRLKSLALQRLRSVVRYNARRRYSISKHCAKHCFPAIIFHFPQRFQDVSKAFHLRFSRHASFVNSTNQQIREGVRGRVRLVRGAENLEQLFLVRLGACSLCHPEGVGGMQKSQRLPHRRENVRGVEAQGGEQGTVRGLLGRVEGNQTGVGHRLEGGLVLRVEPGPSCYWPS